MPVPTSYEAYHLFSLPPALLDNITLREDHSVAQQDESVTSGIKPSDSTTLAPVGSGRACNVCLNATFAGVDEQRSHFRSDWHRYNVKTKLGGGHAVDEPRFASLVEGLEDSLSGTASSTSEDDESDSDAVSTLLSRTKLSKKRSSRSPSPDGPSSAPRSALAWFHSPPSTQIGVYRAIFPTQSTDFVAELKNAQRGHGEEGRTWAVFMTAGGHFAGAIFKVSRTDDEVEADQEEAATALGQPVPEGRKKKKKPKVQKPEIEVLRHKTFHRYTTRRKQGGSQSVNDNAKGKAAKSAGAQLRRYGEQSLRDDIQNLMKEWSDDLDECERVWLRASWSNRKMFMTDNGGLFEKGDERLRTFPFPTRRPTQSEAVRCINELLKVKVTRFTEAELREQDEIYAASIAKPKPKPPPAPDSAPTVQPTKPERPVLTPEQTQLRSKWLRAFDMIERGKLEALKGFLEKESSTIGVDGRVPTWMGYSAGGDIEEESARGRTVLMLAVVAKQEEIVRWLLEEAGANPTLDVATATSHDEAPLDDTPADGETDDQPLVSAPSGRRTAYDLARTADIRNVFRRAAGAFPERWDWLATGAGGARVPSVLTPEMEADRDEKKKARRKGLKDKIREREAASGSKVESEAPPPPKPIPASTSKIEKDPTGPRKLGGVAGAGDGIAGLTPEMRAKVERERRARAAEARLKALAGK